ncbi:MAG: T9SS type A sorting domain-containing protein [Vicingaceae bacterium]|nr:T9SS type A sorting domain-containing protein [Vicingaceae bacterium]
MHYKVRLEINDQNWYNGVKEKTVFVSNTLPPPTSTLSIDDIYLLNSPCFDGGYINVGASISGGVPFPNTPPDPPSLLFDIYPGSHFPHNDSRLVIPPGTTFPHTVIIHIRVREYVMNGTTWNHVDGYDTVTFYDGRINMDAGNDLTLCVGTNFVLGGAPTASGGTPPYIYNWSELTTNNVSDLSNLNVANPIVTANGGSYTYGVTVSDDYGCVSATDQVVVTTQDLVANAGPTKNICIGSTNQTIGLPPVGGLPPYSYAWSPAMDLSCTNCENPTVSPSYPGLITYMVNVTDATGCTSNAQVFVNRDIANPIASITPPNPACEDVPVSLTGSGSNATGPFTYLWSNGSTSPSVTITPSSPAPIILTVTDQYTGCFDIESIPVSPKYDLVSTGTAHIAVCAGIPFTIGNSVNFSGGVSPYNYLWTEANGLSSSIQNPTARYPTVAPLETVHYALEVTDAYGCKFSPLYWNERYFVYSDIPDVDFTIDGGACKNVTCLDNLTDNKFTGAGSYVQSLGFQDITQYSWNFGSGASPSTFSNVGPVYNTWNPANPQPSPDPPCINYSSTGTRTVSLTATNVCGSSTVQKVINVTNPINVVGTELFCGNFPSNFNNLGSPLRGIVALSGDLNCNTVVNNNAVLEVLAAENINIKPGFTAKKGSNFGARLDPFQCYNVTSPRMMMLPEEIDTSVSSSLNESYEILIQPNPNNGLFVLYLPDNKVTSVTIINSIGNVIYTNATVYKQLNIDLSSFPKGIYMIKTLSGKNTAYKKVIKN